MNYEHSLVPYTSAPPAIDIALAAGAMTPACAKASGSAKPDTTIKPVKKLPKSRYALKESGGKWAGKGSALPADHESGGVSDPSPPVVISREVICAGTSCTEGVGQRC